MTAKLAPHELRECIPRKPEHFPAAPCRDTAQEDETSLIAALRYLAQDEKTNLVGGQITLLRKAADFIERATLSSLTSKGVLHPAGARTFRCG